MGRKNIKTISAINITSGKLSGHGLFIAFIIPTVNITVMSPELLEDESLLEITVHVFQFYIAIHISFNA